MNGTQVWFVKLDMGDGEILWGYYYSDEGGTVEAEIFADKAFYSEYEKDLMDFINGLRIVKSINPT